MDDALTFFFYVWSKLVTFLFGGDVKFQGVSVGLLFVAIAITGVVIGAVLTYSYHPVHRVFRVKPVQHGGHKH